MVIWVLSATERGLRLKQKDLSQPSTASYSMIEQKMASSTIVFLIPFSTNETHIIPYCFIAQCRYVIALRAVLVQLGPGNTYRVLTDDFAVGMR